jgi:hypothetical protein
VQARRFPEAIEDEAASLDFLAKEVPAVGKHDRDAGTDRAFAWYEGPLPFDESGGADGHARNIGYGVVRSLIEDPDVNP